MARIHPIDIVLAGLMFIVMLPHLGPLSALVMAALTLVILVGFNRLAGRYIRERFPRDRP
ncbi:MAG: hypothetical protein NVS9B1_05550 [Candidatus Dormibacteraceae bacterium]